MTAPDERYSELPELWPHQVEGVHELLSGSFAEFWDMRAGKTRPCGEALRILMATGQVDSVLVVAPVNAKHMWLQQLETMLPHLEVQILSGLKPSAVTAPAVVMNPDILASRRSGSARHQGWAQELVRWLRNRRAVVILDEPHLSFTRPAAASYRAARDLCRLAERTWLLTGTPFEKSAMDVYWLCKLLGPRFPYYWNPPDSFGKKYCEATWNPWAGGYTGETRTTRAGKKYAVSKGGWTFSGLKNERELWLELRTCAQRFRKEGEYAKRFEVYVDEVDQKVHAHRQDLAGPRSALIPLKVQRTIEHLETFPERPCLVWGHSVALTEALAGRLGAPLIRGGTPAAERDRIHRETAGGRHPVVVLNIRAGSTALDWSFCRRSVFAEMDWRARDLRQAEARVHDPNNRLAPAVIEYLLVRKSVDEYVWDTVLAKGQAIDRLDLAAERMKTLELEELEA